MVTMAISNPTLAGNPNFAWQSNVGTPVPNVPSLTATGANSNYTFNSTGSTASSQLKENILEYTIHILRA